MMPCPDELAVLPSRTIAFYDRATQVSTPDYWTYLALVAGVMGFLLLDWVLVSKHKDTISNIWRKGPKWFRWVSVGALTALVWHLFVQGRGGKAQRAE